MRGEDCLVHLSKRGIEVTIRRGSTRHGQGTGRAIDLVCITDDIDAHMVIHNGIHCGGPGACAMHDCVEFAGGDHFLITIMVQASILGRGGESSPKFPFSWREPDKWLKALGPCEAALRSWGGVLEQSIDNCVKNGVTHTDEEQWLADAAGWMINTIAHVARDAWLHPSVQGRPVKGNTTNNISAAALLDLGISGLDPSLVALQLRKAMASQGVPAALTHRCFRLLKPKQPEPAERMVHEGVLLTKSETHEKWVEQLQSQSKANDCPRQVEATVSNTLRQQLHVAWRQKGHGQFDHDVTAREVCETMGAWDKSDAMPADLMPRALVKCGNDLWTQVVCLLQRLLGPKHLGRRPAPWRQALMVALYKKGSQASIDSYRLIMVRSQLGLLQEGIVTNRIAQHVRASLTEGQSGFVRGCEDPQLLLHEIMADALSLGLCLWMLMGDFQKAFPKTWRHDLLSIIGARDVDGGMFACLCNFFLWDEVVICQAGTSSAVVHEGLPEGGTIGTTLYTTLPDTLVKELLSHGFGLGLDRKVPEAWVGHRWIGMGTPQNHLVQRLLIDIKSGHPLPNVSSLRAWADLEASALKVMDLLSERRLVAIFHADDPVTLASSKGDLQNSTDILSDWASRHRASFHSGKAKSVVVPVFEGCTASHPACAEPVTLARRCNGQLQRVPLVYTLSHRWLGLLWSAELCFLPALSQRVAGVEDFVRELASLVEAGAIPISVAAVVFEAKVDGSLAYGRWLSACVPEAEDLYEKCYGRWALLLLGGSPWRRPAAACSEMGWHLSGYARAVRSVALHRATLACRLGEDVYARSYTAAQDAPRSWNVRSRAMLEAVGLPLFEQSQSLTYPKYKALVTDLLAAQTQARSLASLAESSARLPYTCVQSPVSTALQECREADLDWDTLISVRSWCRIRASLVEVSTRAGRRSIARVQNCIFCGEPCRNPIKHVVGNCTHFSAEREKFKRSYPGPLTSPEDVTLAVLQERPRGLLFKDALNLCTRVDREARKYWLDQ